MTHRYPCGGLSRRKFLAASAASVPLISTLSSAGAEAQERVASGTTHVGGAGVDVGKLGSPGLYPGQVVEVKNPAMIVRGEKNKEAIKATLDRGLKELTGADDAVEAWRKFFEPGDVVGIKVVPNGQPYAHSSYELVLEVIEGLKSAGVRTADMFVYDRYRGE